MKLLGVRKLGALVLLVGMVSITVPAFSQTPISQVLDPVFLSSDQTVTWKTTRVGQQQAAELNQANELLSVVSVAIPAGVELSAFHWESPDILLFSVDQVATVSGTLLRPADVARLESGVITVLFNGASHLIPNGIKVDAVSRAKDDLLLSFDQALNLHGTHLEDNDLVVVDGNNVSVILLGEDVLIPASADIDAAHMAEEEVFVSLDTAATIDGMPVTDDDLIAYNFNDKSWRMVRQVTNQGQWRHADIDAVSGSLADLIDLIFANGFEN